MHIKYQDEAAGSQGFGTTDRTCLEGIRTGLQDLTGKEHHIVHDNEAYWCGCRISLVRYNSFNMHMRYQAGAAGSHGFGTTDRTCLPGIRTGLQDLPGLEQQIQHAYQVSGWGFNISRVQNTRSYMP